MKRTTPEYDQKDIDAGQNAEHLLGDEAFQTALQRARERITNRWMVADTPLAREELHALIVALNYVVAELMATAAGGKQAQHLKKQELRPSTTEGE